MNSFFLKNDFYQSTIEYSQIIENGLTHCTMAVREFRKSMGLPVNSGSKCDRKLHSQLLEEECEELKDAKNLKDTADALADIMVVASGWWSDDPNSLPFDLRDLYIAIDGFCENTIIQGRRINFLKAFDLVHTSNMTKYCTDQNMDATAKKYADMGIIVEFKPTIPGRFACIVKKEFKDEWGKVYPVGKLLKSVDYEGPNWDGSQDWIRK